MKQTKKTTTIVTGGAGFIGSNFIRDHVSPSINYVIFDKLTYAGNLATVQDLLKLKNVRFVKGDISNAKDVGPLFRRFSPSAVINFAAETHVDRSIDGPADFIRTNVNGTFELLSASLVHYKSLPTMEQRKFRFLHVSTDEVYGSLGAKGLFKETTPYSPRSPYSASKAGADHLVSAYCETYGLPTLITNCSNNYGPFQFPEKLIPVTILNALEAKPLPIYGDGKNVRDWIYVGDHCDGIQTVLAKGQPGEKYNIGASREMKNIDIVRTICKVLEQVVPAKKNQNLKTKGISNYTELMTFVPDRPGHDRRYAIDSRKMKTEFNWTAKTNFEVGIKKTITWYVQNARWCQTVQKENPERRRLGLLAKGAR